MTRTKTNLNCGEKRSATSVSDAVKATGRWAKGKRGQALLPLPRRGGEGRGEGARVGKTLHIAAENPLTLTLSPSEGEREAAARVGKSWSAQRAFVSLPRVLAVFAFLCACVLSAPAATTLTNGLVAYLNFDNTLTGQAGTTVSGVAYGSITYSAGRVGSAARIFTSMNGATNNYISLGYPSVLKFSTAASTNVMDFSVSFWVNYTHSTDDQPFISNKNWASGGNVGWVIASLSGGNFKWNYRDDGGSARRDAAAGNTVRDGAWHQIAVTFQRAANASIYVDGQLVNATSIAPDAGFPVGSVDTAGSGYKINLGQDGTGVYTDNGIAEIDMLMDELGIWNRVLTAAEVTEIYNKGAAGRNLTQDPVGPPPSSEITLGPYVKFVTPDSAAVNWLTAATNSSIVEFGETSALGSRVETPATTTNHALTLTGLKPKTKYYYAVKQLVSTQEVSSATFDFETDYNFTPPPAPAVASPYPVDSLTAVYASVAQGILDNTGLTRGYCLDYGCGDGRLAYELARRSELNIIGVAEDAATVARARQALQAAGLYGSRVTIIQSPLTKLPHTKDTFNLIVSADLITATNTPGQAAEMFRVLRPGGGVAWLGYPTGVAGGLSNWPALDVWIKAGISTNNAAILTDSGRSVKVTRNPLGNIGTWSHGYGDPANTANSQDQRIVGTGMRLQWFGSPGPRGMIDRGCRNPQPLSVNGILFTEGVNRLSAQDAYNGRIFWSLEIPKLIRVNIPRDTSNLCADEDSLYLAVKDKCWRMNAYSGDLTQFYRVQSGQSTNYDWGYVAIVSNRVYGSSIKSGAAYTEYSGPAYWYDSLGTESTAKVCSDNFFCLAKPTGLPLWSYTNGVIINSTITIGGGRVYFAESRNATAKNQPTGRITSTTLWQDLYLVALDANSGALVWQQPLTNVAVSPYPAVFFLSYTAEKLLLTSSTSQFYLYALNAQNGASLWQTNHAWIRNNHGGHMYHPVIVSNTVYLEPFAYSITTGAVVKSGLPARAGCSTMSAAANMIHTVQQNYDSAALCFWDLGTDNRRQMVGSRASCWMSLISAGGMVLSPSASAGCTCKYPLQTSIGFEAP